MDRNTIEKILIALILLVCVFIGVKTYNIYELQTRTAETEEQITSGTLSYGRFLEYLKMGWVKQVDLYNNNRKAVVQASSPELGNRPQLVRVDMPIGTPQLTQILREYNINFDAHPAPPKSLFITIASNVLVPLLFVASLVLFFQNLEAFSINAGFPMSLGKSPAKFDQLPDTGISFDDIAGIEEAKAEFEEIVSFLKEPERYNRVGARIPKGVLLVGPPGTGKTLLAKAIASEASVPFFNVAGSEFVEMFVGIGAARIRDLFKRAAQTTPCIVFIDEIDAVGRERGSGVGGGNDEREQTLNQLLTEMDGFKANKGVIVVGATNRVDILDSALLRPGRFDRQTTVNLPDRLGRIGILKIHCKNKPIGEDLSLVQVAGRTPGFSGADLANLLNEAAILATRNKKISITKSEVNEAADRIIGGIAGTPIDDTKNKKLIAYHEVGHAIVASLIEDHDDVEKITLIPRGGAKGLTWFAPDEDQTIYSRAELIAIIVGTLGGLACEQIVFGYPEVTTGASNDLQQVTNIARRMVGRYGMSRLGPMAFEDDSDEEIFLGGNGKEANVDRVSKETAQIIKDCKKNATEIVLNNRAIIDLMVERLLDVETMDGNEFRKLVNEYTNKTLTAIN